MLPSLTSPSSNPRQSEEKKKEGEKVCIRVEEKESRPFPLLLPSPDQACEKKKRDTTALREGGEGRMDVFVETSSIRDK